MLQLLRPFGVACLRTIETRRRALKLEMHKNGSQVVTLNEEDIDDIEQDWGYCLIGYFVGRHTSAFGLKKVIKRWNDTCKYFLHDSDWIVNKFECENDRDNILHDEPHPIFGSTLILKPMPKCFEFGRVESSLMHVWATLPGLPIDVWNAKYFGKIMSKVENRLQPTSLLKRKFKSLMHEFSLSLT